MQNNNLQNLFKFGIMKHLININLLLHKQLEDTNN